MTVRVAEAKDNYFIVKSVDAEKKSKNIIALLPKCLVGKFFFNSLSMEDLTFSCLLVDFCDNSGLPIVTAHSEHLTFASQIPSSGDDFQADSSFVGYVSHSDRKGVTVRFLNGLKKLILVKDLETVQDFAQVYTPGKVVRCSKNKLDRLTLKEQVIYHSERAKQLRDSDKEAQIRALIQEVKH
jgi:hypothetical protein